MVALGLGVDDMAGIVRGLGRSEYLGPIRSSRGRLHAFRVEVGGLLLFIKVRVLADEIRVVSFHEDRVDEENDDAHEAERPLPRVRRSTRSQ